MLEGRVEGIGLPQGKFAVKGREAVDTFSREVVAADHTVAVGLLMDWVRERIEGGALLAVGHRVVHGGPRYWEAQKITPQMIKELHQAVPSIPNIFPRKYY